MLILEANILWKFSRNDMISMETGEVNQKRFERHLAAQPAAIIFLPYKVATEMALKFRGTPCAGFDNDGWWPYHLKSKLVNARLEGRSYFKEIHGKGARYRWKCTYILWYRWYKRV